MHSKQSIGLSDEEIKKVKAKVVPQDSVLMTCVGDLGVVSIAGMPMVINQQLHAFQCKNKLRSNFLMYVLSFQKGYMLKMASSTTVPYMNKAICNSIPMIVPPLKLQDEFTTLANMIRGSLIKKKKSSIGLSEFFSSLTQRAFAAN
ncbi:type I restriction enzyme, S subunit [Nitrosomonas sp. Nm166]|nr:type I restriction enzyme, S subunit [Nitrosomonas sp. Nm166]